MNTSGAGVINLNNGAGTYTFGGLSGSKNLASVITTGLANMTTLNLNPQSGTDVTYSGIIPVNGTMGLTKTGAGTQTLSGPNTYTGDTLVSEGTLALVGGSQTSAITVDGGSLGFTLGSPTTSTAPLTLTSGTVKITGAVDNASDYLLMTASTITGTPTLASPIPNYTLQKAAGDTQLKLVYTPGGSPYDTWSGGAAFDADANNDGVKNGLAWLLGAANKDADATALLPKVSNNAGGLVLTFDCLSAANRGTAVLNVQHSNDLGQLDLWADALVPGTGHCTVTVSGVDFVTTANGALIHVVATIPAGNAAAGKLFGRLNAKDTP